MGGPDQIGRGHLMQILSVTPREATVIAIALALAVVESEKAPDYVRDLSEEEEFRGALGKLLSNFPNQIDSIRQEIATKRSRLKRSEMEFVQNTARAISVSAYGNDVGSNRQDYAAVTKAAFEKSGLRLVGESD